MAVAAAGGVLATIDRVIEGKIRNTFCTVRPPGHHALKDKAMPFSPPMWKIDMKAKFEHAKVEEKADKLTIALDVVDGDKLQFYNPWGSYQPKPLTPAEFITYFDSLATNAVPSDKIEA